MVLREHDFLLGIYYAARFSADFILGVPWQRLREKGKLFVTHSDF